MRIEELKRMLKPYERAILDFLIAKKRVDVKNGEVSEKFAREFLELSRKGKLRDYLPQAREFLLRRSEERSFLLRASLELSLPERRIKELMEWKFYEFEYGNGKNSKETKEKVQKWVKEGRKKKPFLILWGDPGTGKTTMAQKIALFYLRKGKSVEYLDTEKFQRKAYEFDDLANYIDDSVAGADLLVIDDILTFLATEHRREILFTIVNKRYVLKKDMIITTNRDLFEEGKKDGYISLVADRLKELGEFVHFDYPSLRDEKIREMARKGKIELKQGKEKPQML